MGFQLRPYTEAFEQYEQSQGQPWEVQKSSQRRPPHFRA
jgi:hypothetical protein